MSFKTLPKWLKVVYYILPLLYLFLGNWSYSLTYNSFIIILILFPIYTIGNSYIDYLQIKKGENKYENGTSSVDHNFEVLLAGFITFLIAILSSYLFSSSTIFLLLFTIFYSILSRWALFDIVLNKLRKLPWNYQSNTSIGDKNQSIFWFIKNPKKNLPKIHIVCILILLLTNVVFILWKK